MKILVYVLSILLLFSIGQSSFGQKRSKDKNKETTVEKDLPTCTGISRDKRPTVSVSDFLVSAKGADNQIGGELATMLSSALTNTQCFRVLRSASKLKDAKGEKFLEQEGTTESTGSQKMLSTQVLIEGEVTEFNISSNSGGFAGVKIKTKDAAMVGMIITGYDPKTREQLFSKSFNKESKMGGSKATLFGLDVGSSSIKTPAVGDACEKAIIDIVNYIAENKGEFELPDAMAGNHTVAKKFDASNCMPLKQGYVPKIMVILPEFHITQRIPDPAGETEINRKFIEAGFSVVDPAMFASLQNGTRFNQAAKDPAKAISLGREFGADIVIYGEAFSQRTGASDNMVTCRARVEVRAVKTDDATIVAANGLEAGAQDISEFVGAKAALRSAASLTADYMLEQFCSKNLSFSKTAAKPQTGAAKQLTITEITIQNATELSKWKPVVDLLNSKHKILEKSSAGGVAYLRVEHQGTIDDLADYIDTKLGSKYAVKDFGAGKMVIAVK